MHLLQLQCRVNWTFAAASFRFAVRVCVSVSVIELTCDVTIAVWAPAHSVGRPAVLLPPTHSFTQSVSVGLLIAPRHLCFHARCQLAWPVRLSRCTRAAHSLMKSISCSVVLHAFTSLLYFRVSFVFEFKQWIKSVFTADAAKLPWKEVEAAADSCDSWPIGPPLFFLIVIKWLRIN